ncbi:MAG: hypothetical protein L0H41_09585, partial [Microlunatus sp.]|nr:hypothetical protein [Microlunatus sp.]
EAPDRADQLLGALLRIPDPALVSTWLAVCSEHGRSVAAVRWTKLARLAARSTAYDRPMLGAALGARGRWFLGQNPEWRRLAADVEAATSTRVTRAGDQPALTVDDVLAEPERLLDQPQPWRAELVAAAYAVLGGAGRAVPAPSFASRLGVALPAALYPSIAAAGEYYLLAPDASPARRRAVRERFVALECAAYAGAQIERSFSDHARDVVRVEVPHV